MSETEQVESGTETTKRARVTDKEWIGADGEPTKDAREAAGVRIKVLGAGAALPDFLLADYPENVRQGLAAFGLDVILTNTIGGKALSPDDKVESILARHETLAAGEWSSRKGGEGPRISLLAQAVVAAYAKAGVEETLESVSQKLREKGEEGRKKILDNKAVKAEYERLRAEAAAARAAKAAEEAGDPEEGVADLDL